MDSNKRMGKKQNNLKRENIVKYWKANIGPREINVPWEKALTHCWACGLKTALEKAHIIPEVLGGPMTESNMVLFCKNCNAQNPETVYEDYFWLWIKGRKKLQEEYNVPYLTFASHAQEYELMFGKENYFDKVTEIEVSLYFGEENCVNNVKKFCDLSKHECFFRYPSSSMIIAYKYYEFIESLLEKYRQGDPDGEVSKWFPKAGNYKEKHKYLFGKIPKNSKNSKPIEKEENEEFIIEKPANLVKYKLVIKKEEKAPVFKSVLIKL